jgi:hypothetical protein
MWLALRYRVLYRHSGQHDAARVATKTQAALSAPEARGVVYQPIIDEWPVTRRIPRVWFKTAPILQASEKLRVALRIAPSHSDRRVHPKFRAWTERQSKFQNCQLKQSHWEIASWGS